jgi:2-amino-4-hydroxy-6-hydroxymethyldihydropteridine diphosphokinase
MEESYLLLGSNLGDSKEYLKQAVDKISGLAGEITGQSALYQTASWGKTDQPDFINQVLRIKTNLTPQQLLETILVIEKSLGRQRTEKWGSRTIDIDILFYGEQVIREENLVIPHPFLHERRFTLLPLLELCPDLVHPVLDQTIKQLYQLLDDQLSVIKI